MTDKYDEALEALEILKPQTVGDALAFRSEKGQAINTIQAQLLEGQKAEAALERAIEELYNNEICPFGTKCDDTPTERCVSGLLEGGPTMKQKWYVAVGKWGVVEFDCTEAEAEEWRRHKANWEQCPAIKITFEDFEKLSDEQIERHWAYKAIRQYLQALSQPIAGE